MCADIPVFQALAKSLEAHGVKTMFGLMGDANLFMVDHWVQHHGGKFIRVAHEASAVLAAAGYAQTSGGIGVATVTHGPALTNTITALVETTRTRAPIVLLAGDTPAEKPRHMQKIDQRELIKTTGAGFEQIKSPAMASEDIARAFYRAGAEERPIVLNMPVDYMWQEVSDETPVMPHYAQPRGMAQSDMLDEAVGMIASARRPLIIAGHGAMDAREALVKLGERLDAPLATTVKGKGTFQGHKNHIGIFGTLSTPAAYDVMAQADCVITFGSSLNDYTMDGGKLVEGKRVVQVDTSPAAIGGCRHPDAALIADAAEAAEKIIYWLDEAEIAPSGFASEMDHATLLDYPNPPNKTPDGYVNYIEAIDKLEKALPQDRILVTDIGRFMLQPWCRMSVPNSRSFIPCTNFTCVGLGLQTAIGAAEAAPGRTVVSFTGDGGFMMAGINEFRTAVSQGLDIVVVVANDSAYGAEHIQFTNRGMDPTASRLDWASFADVARALGGTGLQVTSSETLDAAIKALKGRRPGPMLIELVLDPADMPGMQH